MLTPAALVTRLRWQLDGWLTGRHHDTDGVDDDATGGLVLIRIAPDRVVPAGRRQLGFWGGDAAARGPADQALGRPQGMLEPAAGVNAARQRGRLPSARGACVPVGDG